MDVDMRCVRFSDDNAHGLWAGEATYGIPKGAWRPNDSANGAGADGTRDARSWDAGAGNAGSGDEGSGDEGAKRIPHDAG